MKEWRGRAVAAFERGRVREVSEKMEEQIREERRKRELTMRSKRFAQLLSDGIDSQETEGCDSRHRDGPGSQGRSELGWDAEEEKREHLMEVDRERERDGSWKSDAREARRPNSAKRNETKRNRRY